MRQLAIVCLLLASTACKPSPSLYVPVEQASALHSTVATLQAQYDTITATSRDIPVSLATIIREAATQNNIPLPIAFSLVRVESDFTPSAISHAGALGLTQVMPATGMAHCGLDTASLMEPSLNALCGFSYLAMLYRHHKSWPMALAAYNVGDARRARAHLTGEPNGASYADKVLSTS